MNNASGQSADVMAAVAGLRPTRSSLAAEWGADRQAEILHRIVGDEPAAGRERAHEIPLQFVPAGHGSRRSGRVSRLALGVSIAAVVAAAGTVVAAVSSGNGGGDLAAGALGPAFDPPTGLSSDTIGPGQYSYRALRQLDVDADGKPVQNDQAMVERNWIAANGDVVSIRTGSQNGCTTFPSGGAASFIEPTLSFFESLPTDVDALNAYMRAHVEGSSSRNEAVFVSVGDALQTADGLASPRLRAAFVAVLSRTPGVSLHEDVTDYLGRPALRADFVDQRIRPGEVQSLYFDPTTFALLEDREGGNGQPSTYDGPSPAYDSTRVPDVATDPEQLTGAAFIDVMTSEKTVDTLPSVAHCAAD
jgi:hypothetical protein